MAHFTHALACTGIKPLKSLFNNANLLFERDWVTLLFCLSQFTDDSNTPAAPHLLVLTNAMYIY